MALHQARAVVAGLNRIGVPIPAPVVDALTRTDALLAVHTQLVARIKPAGPMSYPPAVQAARAQALEAMTVGARKGKLDPDRVLTLTDDVTTAQQDVARITEALDLIDSVTGGAATNPHADSTEVELSLIAAADDVFAAMHDQVQEMARAVPGIMAPLPSLPTDAHFALTAKPEAVAAYRAVLKEAQRYAELRSVQRALLTLSETAESVFTLWPWAEVRTGLGGQPEPEVLDGWINHSAVKQEPAEPTTPHELAQRFLSHVSRHGPERVWVPSIAELRYTREHTLWQSSGFGERPRRPASLKAA